MEKALAREREILRDEEQPSAAEAARGQNAVDDFLSKIKFFPPRIETAARILQLNQRLSDDYVERELESLPEGDSDLARDERSEGGTVGGWLKTVMDRVSVVVFHEDDPGSEEDALTEGEVFSLFQKTLSETIYNHLSMLSRTPHARKRRPFSIMEELTEGIAEDIGLGLYRRAGTPDHLREEAKSALHDLALEFQEWLLKQGSGGRYTPPWGLVCSEEAKRDEDEAEFSAIVLLNPDVQARAGEAGTGGMSRRVRSGFGYVPGSLAASSGD